MALYSVKLEKKTWYLITKINLAPQKIINTLNLINEL